MILTPTKRFQAPNPPQVTLTPEQMEYAAEFGRKRRAESRARGLMEIFADDGSGEERDIVAAQAELAAAIYLKKPWNGGVNSFKRADVGQNIQVRYTHWPDGCLCARPKDNPYHIYVLVTGVPPTFNIVGWLTGRDIMVDEFKITVSNEYWRAPQDKINLFKNDDPSNNHHQG